MTRASVAARHDLAPGRFIATQLIFLELLSAELLQLQSAIVNTLSVHLHLFQQLLGLEGTETRFKGGAAPIKA